jgi:hypothetical protein
MLEASTRGSTQVPGSVYEALLGVDLRGRRPLYTESGGFSFPGGVCLINLIRGDMRCAVPGPFGGQQSMSKIGFECGRGLGI